MTAALHGKSLCAAVMTVSSAFSLTVEQRLAYEQDGLVALPGAVTRPAASAMADQLWRAMEGQYGARRDKPATWTMHIPSGLKPDPADAFAAMASPTVVAVLDELLGANWIRPARWGMPLVTFPSTAIEWDVPAKQWHLDGPATPEAPAIARIFLLLAPVPPGSGGTLIPAGSHRLVRRLAAKAGRTLRSPEAKEQLAADYHWFANLICRRRPRRTASDVSWRQARSSTTSPRASSK